MRSRFYILGIWIVASLVALFATLYSPKEKQKQIPVAFLEAENRWADSLIQNMNTLDKISQLFILVDSAKEEKAVDSSLFDFIAKQKPGGLLLRNFSVNKQFENSQEAQRRSDVPLLIGIDDRSKDPNWVRMPSSMSIASIEDDRLLKELGHEIGVQTKDLGAHFVLSPSFNKIYTKDNFAQVIEKEKILNKEITSERLIVAPKAVQAFFPRLFDSTQIKA
ncbi:MAG: hypothetical protein AAF696_26010, partial [Bacteroidota bacterium]